MLPLQSRPPSRLLPLLQVFLSLNLAIMVSYEARARAAFKGALGEASPRAPQRYLSVHLGQKLI